MYRVIFLAEAWDSLVRHFEGAAPQEDGAFLLLRRGRGSTGSRLLIHDVLLPPPNAWESQGADWLRPSGQWLSAVIGAAVERSSGFAFIHSHPGTMHPASLSPIDRSASIALSKSLCPMTGQPFASMVWSGKGVTGWVFESDDPARPRELDRVEIMGRGRVQILPESPRAVADPQLDDRQVRALGAIGNATLRDLRVGIVGVGGTGSPIAEQLARMGVDDVSLIDPDVLDTPSNLRRLVGSYPSDVNRGARKVVIVGRHLKRIAPSMKTHPMPLDVRSERAARQLLDLDLAINTTDNQSSRAFLNQLAYQYWLPVIDVGVRVGTTISGMISGMPTEVRVLLPDTGCLWCRNVLDAGTIRLENLPPAELQGLAREGYVQGLQGPQPSLAPLNYFASGLALLAALRMYSSQPLESQSFIVDGWGLYVHPLASGIDHRCICHRYRGLADQLPVVFLRASQGTEIDVP